MKIMFGCTLALFLFAGNVAFAVQEVSGFCSGCSHSSKENLAKSWANTNITPAQAAQRVSKHYIVIDVEAESITKFEVYKFLLSRDLSTASIAKEIEPEAEDLKKAESLFSLVNFLYSTFEAIEVPGSVIENAWEFTGCAYCSNELTDYLRRRDDVVTAFQRIEKVLRRLNLVGDKLNETWVLALESGGEVHAEISLIHADEFLIMDALKVLDLNENNVPLYPADLSHGMTLKGNINQYENLQRYIELFGFKFEESEGQVIVTET